MISVIMLAIYINRLIDPRIFKAHPFNYYFFLLPLLPTVAAPPPKIQNTPKINWIPVDAHWSPRYIIFFY